MCTLIQVIWKRLWCTVNLKNDPSCFSGNTAGEIIDEEDFKFNLSGIIGKRVLMCYKAFIFVCSKGVKARLDLKIEKKENLFSLWFSMYIPFLKKIFY